MEPQRPLGRGNSCHRDLETWHSEPGGGRESALKMQRPGMEPGAKDKATEQCEAARTGRGTRENRVKEAPLGQGRTG